MRCVTTGRTRLAWKSPMTVKFATWCQLSRPAGVSTETASPCRLGEEGHGFVALSLVCSDQIGSDVLSFIFKIPTLPRSRDSPPSFPETKSEASLCDVGPACVSPSLLFLPPKHVKGPWAHNFAGCRKTEGEQMLAPACQGRCYWNRLLSLRLGQPQGLEIKTLNLKKNVGLW